MVELVQELETAMRKVIVARDRLNAASPDAPEYQSNLINYLQATVHHLAVLAVAQARQYEEIAGEVSELRARVDRSAAGGALMGSQLRFRADPVRHFEGRRDPRDRLEQLRPIGVRPGATLRGSGMPGRTAYRKGHQLRNRRLCRRHALGACLFGGAGPRARKRSG